MFKEHSQWWQSQLFMILVAAILGLTVIWQVAKILNEFKAGQYIGKPTTMRDMITITGDGKVKAIPDVATVSVGLSTEKKTVPEAQKENTDKFNRLLDEMKKYDIKKEDLQTTDYRINPVYDYTPNKGSTIRGYEVYQSVRVKVKNLDKLGDILTAAGQGGANQVSGVSFAVDDPEKLKQEARELALQNAQDKAKSLAKISGVKLGRIVAFNEYESSPPPPPYPFFGYAREGLGGGDVSAPALEKGSLEIQITATVSYEIL